ncbi:MAG: ExbD/TolR family protein [Alphaproteobacteria bacterium]
MITFPTKKRLKINIIPLIDIIFLMLVFFMLATNFNKNFQINFKVGSQKEVVEKSTDEKLMILKIKSDEIYFRGNKINLESLEDKYLKKWNSFKFERVIILNDKKSSVQSLISVLDKIKKYKLDNVNFSNEP